MGEHAIYNIIMKEIKKEVNKYYSNSCKDLISTSYAHNENKLYLRMTELKRAFDKQEIMRRVNKKNKEEIMGIMMKYERVCLLLEEELGEMMKWNECNEIPLGKLFKRAGLV